jgi:hypothetical protein
LRRRRGFGRRTEGGAQDGSRQKSQVTHRHSRYLLRLPRPMNTYRIVELCGDGISPELSRSVHAVAERLPCRVEFVSVDLSEPNRRRRGAALYHEAAALLREHAVGLKYPTATTAESPNAVRAPTPCCATCSTSR